MVHRRVPTSALRQPLYLSPPVDIDSFDAAVEAVIHAIYASRDPILVVDALVARHSSRAVARNLADVLQFASFSPPMGKSILNETKPYFYGCYNGNISYPGIQETVETYSDLVLHLGPFICDSNTGGFTTQIPEEKLISVKPNSVTVFGKEFPGIPMRTCTFLAFSLLSRQSTNEPCSSSYRPFTSCRSPKVTSSRKTPPSYTTYSRRLRFTPYHSFRNMEPVRKISAPR